MAIDGGVKAEISFKPQIDILKKRLQKKFKNLTYFRPLNKQISILFEKWVLRNFKEQGRVRAKPKWAPLKAGGRWKRLPKGSRKFDRRAKVMQDTGNLKQSFFPGYSDRYKARVSTGVPYAAQHHFGLRGLPERQLVPRKEQVIEDVRKTCRLFAKKELAKK